MVKFALVAALVTLIVPAICSNALAQGHVDAITFGDHASEQRHSFTAIRSETITGALDQPARQLLPLEPTSWDGGKVAFTMKVDPERPTYFTLKMWGGDFGENRGRLLLFVEGKQLGHRHLGDVDILDIMSNEPRFPGRFVYKTLPLPKAMTAGKASIQLEIRALGRIWGYGETWEQFQKMLEEPSRGIYSAYTHTDPFFIPPADERQGEAPTGAAVRQQPGPEVLDRLKERVNGEIAKLMSGGNELRQVWMQFLAEAYHVSWTDAYQRPEVVQKLVKALDFTYRKYRDNPRLAERDPETWNADWFGLGPSGDVIRLLGKQLDPHLDSQIEGANLTRREGWSRMLQHCRDWHAQHRRLYTNQSMINDLYGIYLANRGVATIDPENAWREERALRYLYESIGLQPWLGNDTDDGGSEMPVGPNYMQLTAKGLTKELGYVGSYGEVLDWVTAIYEATRPTPDAPGDEKIKQQLIKIARARTAFRHPAIDIDGHPAMQLETVVGWRDTHYPGDIVYAQRTAWDGGPFESPAATLDPVLVGYAQQMLEDNQFFKAVNDRLKDRNFRVTAGLLGYPEQYRLIAEQPPSPHRLPMAPTQPDFVFTDEENGVVAIKNGNDIIYASLYWRARYAVNFLARIHHLTPTVERDATIWQDVRYQDSGMTYTRDGSTIEAQTRRHEKSRGDLRQALEGEVLPIAKIPATVHGFRPGKENVYAGKGDFYTLRYGDYLVGMNCTTDRTFTLAPLYSRSVAKDLVTGNLIDPAQAIEVGPRATAVVYIGAND